MQNRKLSRRDFLRGASIAGVGVLMTACGGQSTSSSGTAPEPAKETQQEVSSAPSAPEAIPLVMWYQAENHKPEYDRRTAELQDKFNITLSWEILDRDAMTKKFPTTLMAGSGFPDIIEQNAGDIVKFMKGTDAEIPFVKLNDAITSSPYNGGVLQSRYDRYTKDGNIYGTPHDVHPVLILYHDAGWKELGVDLETVETWDDYIAACETVGAGATMADGRPLYAVMESNYSAGSLSLMLQNGVWWTDEAGEPTITEPGFKAAQETWIRMNPYRVDIDWGNQVAMFKDGQFLSQFVPDWLYGIHQQGTAEDTNFIANSPMRLKYMPDGPKAGSWGGAAGSVVKQADNIDKAIEVLLYLYFEDGEGQLAQRFVDTGILPPVPANWENPIYQEEVPYVGGQQAGTIFIEAAKVLPSYSENWKTNLVASAWGEQASLWIAEEIDLDTAISTADTNARAEIDKNA